LIKFDSIQKEKLEIKGKSGVVEKNDFEKEIDLILN